MLVLSLAQAYRRFGSRVSVVETAPRLAAREDNDVAAQLLERMLEEGVEVHLCANVSRVEGRSGKAVRLHLRTAAADRIIEGSDILVAVGRTPNTAEDSLNRIGPTLAGRKNGAPRGSDRLIRAYMFLI